MAPAMFFSLPLIAISKIIQSFAPRFEMIRLRSQSSLCGLYNIFRVTNYFLKKKQCVFPIHALFYFKTGLSATQ